LILIRRGSELTELKYPLLFGTSRKGFIGEIIHQTKASERDWGTAATCTAAIQQGADILRVHNVEKLKDVITISDAIYRERSEI
jgi:dihydropteroate synthase